MSPAANSAVAAIAASGFNAPPSFNGDGQLFMLNLFLSTAFMQLAVAIVGMLGWALWRSRKRDRLWEPATIYRVQFLCAALALTLRAGAEGAELLAWSPQDPVLTARVVMAKRWILPASYVFTGVWMALLVLSRKSIEAQLRRQPLPVQMLDRLPVLKRPIVAVTLCAVMAVGVVWMRG